MVERRDPFTGSWSEAPKLPQRRSAGAAATLGGRMYVAGGYVSSAAHPDPVETASVLVFSPQTGKWRPVAPLHQSRGYLRMLSAGGHLYAIGGNHGGNTVATTERYDPSTNTWTVVKPMRQDRGGPGAVVRLRGSQRLIVVVGGAHCVADSCSRRRSTETYDLTTGRWRMLDVQLPRARSALVCALEDDGTVLAIGGEDDTGATAVVTGLDLG